MPLLDLRQLREGLLLHTQQIQYYMLYVGANTNAFVFVGRATEVNGWACLGLHASHALSRTLTVRRSLAPPPFKEITMKPELYQPTFFSQLVEPDNLSSYTQVQSF